MITSGRGSGAVLALVCLSTAALLAAAGAQARPEPASPTTVRVEALRTLPAKGECLRRAKLRLGGLDGGSAGSGHVCVTGHEELPCGAECGLVREALDLELRLHGGTVRASLAGYVASVTDTGTGTVSVDESFSGPVTGVTGTLAPASGSVTWKGLLLVGADGTETGSRLLTVALEP